MKNITYTPSGGVCSRRIEVEIENDIIQKVIFTGGCIGNTQGISRLVVGMTTDEVVNKLQGIDCKGRGTSCPDQLTRAILENRICSEEK